MLNSAWSWSCRLWYAASPVLLAGTSTCVMMKGCLGVRDVVCRAGVVPVMPELTKHTSRHAGCQRRVGFELAHCAPTSCGADVHCNDAVLVRGEPRQEALPCSHAVLGTASVMQTVSPSSGPGILPRPQCRAQQAASTPSMPARMQSDVA